MTNDKINHVFVSYVREDSAVVKRLCAELTKYGVNVWLDRHEIKPGARWKDAIREAIREGDFFVACFSKSYTSREKSFMNEELVLAIDELRIFSAKRVWFIPVLLSECDVPVRSIGGGETLLDIQWVPLYENWEAGIKQLLSVIKPISKELRHIMNAMHSQDQGIRFQAIEALTAMNDPAAIPALAEAVRDDYWLIRRRAVIALAHIGTLEAKPVLIEAAKDEEWVVRKVAIAALGYIGGILPVSKYIEFLSDDDKRVRAAAVVNLGVIGDPAAVPALIAALTDESPDVCERAAAALFDIGTPEAMEAITKFRSHK